MSKKKNPEEIERRGWFEEVDADETPEPVSDAEELAEETVAEAEEAGEREEPEEEEEPSEASEEIAVDADDEDGSDEADDEDDEDGEDEDGEDSEDTEDESGEEEGDESPLTLSSVVEAILFAARDPLKLPQIARAVGKRTRQEMVREAIGELNVHYLETGRAFEIAEISGRYQLMSRPEFAPHIMKIYPKRELSGEKEKVQRLTPAALDTLAIIAYKQPVTRAEIEHIRGVGCGPVLKALMERDSIRIAGKRMDMLGQPLVYGTTENFLAEFGLGSLDELPMRNDFLAILGADIPPVEVMEEASEPSAETEVEAVIAMDGDAADEADETDEETDADLVLVELGDTDEDGDENESEDIEVEEEDGDTNPKDE